MSYISIKYVKFRAVITAWKYDTDFEHNDY